MNIWLKLSLACWLCIILILVILSQLSRAENWVDEMNNTSYSPPDPLTSYSFKESGEWTGWNKFWFGSAIATFGVGDTMSTLDATSSEN